MNTILVSGATGFLGSHLCRRFLSEGNSVIGLRRAQSDLSRLALCMTHPNYIDALVDEPIAPAQPCSSLVHTATCYGRNGESIEQIEDANIRMPLLLIERMHRQGLQRFINIDTTLPPDISPYAKSKHQFRLDGRALCDALGIAFINARLEYMYGPGDDATKFPMFVIRECVRNAPVIRMSPGEQLRDFVYVDDVVNAISILESYHSSTTSRSAEYGIGTGTAISLKAFAHAAKAAANATTQIEAGSLPYREGELMYSCANIRAICSVGWLPTIGLDEGLQRTIRMERNQ